MWGICVTFCEHNFSSYKYIGPLQHKRFLSPFCVCLTVIPHCHSAANVHPDPFLGKWINGWRHLHLLLFVQHAKASWVFLKHLSSKRYHLHWHCISSENTLQESTSSCIHCCSLLATTHSQSCLFWNLISPKVLPFVSSKCVTCQLKVWSDLLQGNPYVRLNYRTIITLTSISTAKSPVPKLLQGECHLQQTLKRSCFSLPYINLYWMSFGTLALCHLCFATVTSTKIYVHTWPCSTMLKKSFNKKVYLEQCRVFACASPILEKEFSSMALRSGWTSKQNRARNQGKIRKAVKLIIWQERETSI